MFGVLISYLPNFNVGQENEMANSTGSWNNEIALSRTNKKSRERKRILKMHFEHIYVEEKELF